MNVQKQKCRVCGKDYEPCRTVKANADVFHWREVACTPECGAIYLQQIIESRTPAPVAQKKRRAKKSEVVTDDIEI